METEQPKKTRAPRKIIAWIIAILAMWFLLHNPTIFDAVLTFCLAGVVPGTGVVLSPNAVIAIVGGMLGLIVLLIIGIPIVRRAYRRRSRVALHPSSEQPATIASDVPVVVSNFETAPIPRTITKKPRHPLLVKLGVAVVLVRAKLQALLAKLGPKTGRVLSIIVVVISHEAKQLALLVRKLSVRLHASIIDALKWSRDQLVVFWRWLKPHIHAFDAWLAKRVKPYQKKITKKAHKNDLFLLFRDIVRGIKRELKPFGRFTLWGKPGDEQQRSSDTQKDSE